MTAPAAGVARVVVAGEELVLLPERAIHWARRETLLVADPHFGKAATFRFAGLFVPRGTTVSALARLDRMLEATGARRLVFLGDFLHAREGRSEEMLNAVAAWRRQHATTEIVLVRGNHDRRAGDPPGSLAIECVDAPHVDAPFVLSHHPRANEGHYVLSGHVHPCVRVRGRARQSHRLPCFWFGRDTGVLPAFGEFTGCAEVEPVPGDRVFVVAENEVVSVGGDAPA